MTISVHIPLPADSVASHINGHITRGLEDIYSRFGSYADRNRHVDCLRAMEEFRRGVLDHMEFVHSQLRLRLSATARVNQLPADVLIHVFTAMDFTGLVTATHVCHQWRKLGLETPDLWTTLTLDGPVLQDSQLLLNRSKAAQIDLSCSPTYQKSVSADLNIASLGPYMNRLRHLSIRPQPAASLRPPPVDWSAPMLRESKPLLLSDIPHLKSLTIDWDQYGSSVKITIPQDTGVPVDHDDSSVLTMPSRSRRHFSSLTDVSLLRGVYDFEFLHHCTQLRNLSLVVRDDVTCEVIISIMKVNPLLKRLELYVDSSDTLAAPPPRQPWGHRLSHPSLRSIVLQSGESVHSFNDWSIPTMLQLSNNVARASYFLSCVDYSDVSDIEIGVFVGVTPTDHAFYTDVLGQLQTIVVLDACYGKICARDLRGHKRVFTNASIAAPLWHSFIPGIQLQSLRVRVCEWHDVSMQSGSPALLTLEELWLSGRRMEYATLSRPATECPRLQSVTLDIRSEFDPVTFMYNMLPDDDWLVVGVALALRRICHPLRLRLQRLTIISAFRDTRESTWLCAPPFPEAVTCFSSIANSETGRSLPEFSDNYSHAAWPLFPSVPVPLAVTD